MASGLFASYSAAAEPLPFGVASFHMTSCADATAELGGACDQPFTQAGGTPYELTSKVTLNAEVEAEGFLSTAGGDVKDIAANLPPGLIVDPQTTTRCPLSIFDAPGGRCPASTQVGTALLMLGGHSHLYPLYNVEPQLGRPAAFGIANVAGRDYLISGSVRSREDYGLSAISSGIATVARITSATIALWGVPSDPSHDERRGQTCHWLEEQPPAPPSQCEGGGEQNGDQNIALVRLPTACTGQPLVAVAAADSWEQPGALNLDGSWDPSDPRWTRAQGTLPALSGCNSLAFDPSLAVQPDETSAGEPAGLGVSLDVPQTQDPSLLATPHVRAVHVALPMGMVVSPSAAQGLTACRDDPGADPRFSANELGPTSLSPASCEPSSQVGMLRITSPDLPAPLDGRVFLGAPLCGPCSPSDAQEGRMVRLYFEAIGEGNDALIVKLVGYGSIDQQTGELITAFVENPQLPFEKLTVSLGGGPRATLANPRTCGPAATNAELVPWSAPFTPEVLATSHYEVTGCPPPRFTPTFTAGTTNNQAGGFSPFTLAFGRTDADAFLRGVQLRMPSGLLGMLSNVGLCGEPQAAEGTCGAQSLIGRVQVLTGPGAEPLLVTGGQVFITGPYCGSVRVGFMPPAPGHPCAPFGLSIVVPAKAGPYTLSGTTGNGTVVVRATINIDPSNAQLIVTADPLPTALDGIPLQLRAVNVTINRPNFVFNPTDCNPLRIAGTLASTLGDGAQVTAPFQVTNCAALSFRPRFTVSTNGRTSRVAGASLDAKLTYPRGAAGTQANIASVKVDLPRQLPSRLSTLQHACPAAVFDANASNCPSASIVGVARASTPVLPEGLAGPAYFVSHGGEKFPSLVIVLEGDGVRVDLTGTTFIGKSGVTSSTFSTLPDVPVSSFELYLPQGAHSALAANAKLCRLKLAMPTAFTAQNGLTIHASTPIRVSHCPRARASRKRHRAPGVFRGAGGTNGRKR